jgi:hypothetical protein
MFFILKEIIAKKNRGFTKFNVPKLVIFWPKKQVKMADLWRIYPCKLLIINEL